MKKLSIFLFMSLFLSACTTQQDLLGDDVFEENLSEDNVSEEDLSGNDVLVTNDIVKELAKNESPHFLQSTDWRGMDSPGCGRILSFNLGKRITYAIDISSEEWEVLSGTSYAYYHEDENAYYIVYEHYDEQGELVEEELVDIWKIIYADDYYLVLDSEEECYPYYVYYDYKVDLPDSVVHESAKQNVGTYWFTKPRLRIAGYEEGKILVFQCTYDENEAAKAKVWELNLSEDCEFKSVIYSVSSDTVEETILVKSDYESIPSKYADGFFAFNNDGEVSSVVFYGEAD